MASVESVTTAASVGDITSLTAKETLCAADRPAVYSSTELLQGRREAWIEHGDQMYRLRLTHAGKLYLTK